MSTLNTTIETAYGKASTCTQPESQRWLELAMMAASRGGGEGIAIFLRCVAPRAVLYSSQFKGA